MKQSASDLGVGKSPASPQTTGEGSHIMTPVDHDSEYSKPGPSSTPNKAADTFPAGPGTGSGSIGKKKGY